MTMKILLTPKIDLINDENSKSFVKGSKMINVNGQSISFSFSADSLTDAPILKIEGSCVLTHYILYTEDKYFKVHSTTCK